MIIGLNGYIKSGKDTVGSIIQYLHSNSDIGFDEWIRPKIYHGYDISSMSMYQDEKDSWQIRKFAATLKEVASIMTGIPVEKFEDQDFKASYMSDEWAINGMPLTVREFLQKLGTDAIRHGLHQNAWVNSAMIGLTGEKNIIFTDCRFPNEAKAIKDRGGVVVRINRYVPGASTKFMELHESETALDNWDFDYTIWNNGTKDDLINQVRELLRKVNQINLVNT